MQGTKPDSLTLAQTDSPAGLAAWIVEKLHNWSDCNGDVESWDAGLDYADATGHGVGSYLCVHEGPQNIFNTAAFPGIPDEPLVPGMILSNEPGCYKAGEYGIRIENLILVIEREIPGAERADALRM